MLESSARVLKFYDPIESDVAAIVVFSIKGFFSDMRTQLICEL